LPFPRHSSLREAAIPAAEAQPYDSDEQQLLPWEALEVLESIAAAEFGEYLD